MKLILQDYENYVYKTARSFHRRNYHVELDDLIQAGWVGLLEAYNKYDESYGTKFLTYASFYVKKHIQETIHKNTVVEFPRDITRLYFRIEDAKNEIAHRDNEEVTLEKVAEKTGISAKKIRKYESYFMGFNPSDNIDDIENPEVDVRFETIRTIVDELPERQKEMLLDRLEGRTLKEIGVENDLCIERIRQLLVVILDKVRKKVPADPM
jgi:RNA polymerase sporulation-specific sigma factor